MSDTIAIPREHSEGVVERGQRRKILKDRLEQLNKRIMQLWQERDEVLKQLAEIFPEQFNRGVRDGENNTDPRESSDPYLYGHSIGNNKRSPIQLQRTNVVLPAE